MARTKIEWATYTWNPISGCDANRACWHFCYARRQAPRLVQHGYPIDDPFRPTVHPNRFNIPEKLKKEERIFVGSMGDVFQTAIKNEVIFQLLDIAYNVTPHRYLFLTKRYTRIQEAFSLWARKRRFEKKTTLSPRVWFGASAINQKMIEEIDREWEKWDVHPWLYLSLEPLLEPVEIPPSLLSKVSWIIVGGQTGPGSAPLDPNWALSCLEKTKQTAHCQDRTIPFFFKKMGGWRKGQRETPPKLQIREIPEALKLKRENNKGFTDEN